MDLSDSPLSAQQKRQLIGQNNSGEYQTSNQQHYGQDYQL